VSRQPHGEDDPVRLFGDLENTDQRDRRADAARAIVEMRDPSRLRSPRHLEVIAAAEAFLRVMSEEDADALLAKRAAPLRAKAAERDRKRRRAADLKASGMSVPRIAQVMLAEGLIRGDRDPVRRVRTLLAPAKSRTDREVSA
jgi:hypothetical protein